MSKADTLKQKIERKIDLIFSKSEHLYNQHKEQNKDYWKPFAYLESKLHLYIFHHQPLKQIDLSEELKLLENLLNNYPYNPIKRKIVEDYYNEASELQILIEKK